MLHLTTTLTPNLASVFAIIYDVDDCLAPHTNHHIGEEWLIIFAEDFNISLQEARTLNDAFYKTPGAGCTATSFANAYGKPLSWVDEVYARSAPHSSARFIAAHQPDGELAKLTAALYTRNIAQLILTLGHPHHADPVINHLGMAPYIPAHHRFYRANKHTEADYKKVLYVLDLPPENVLMVEDSPKNLVAAAALGMQTALVGGRDPGTYAPSIHHIYPTVEYLQQARLAA